jgi:hypothetical protein
MALLPALAAGEEKKEEKKAEEPAKPDPNKPNIALGLLAQGQAQIQSDANVAGDDFGFAFFLRRARIILKGNANKWIHFFVETDNPNWGKNGNWTQMLFIQDAWVDFQIRPELKIAAGMILLPFTHNCRQGATSLATLDYHNLFSSSFITSMNWRDMGLEARGLLGGGKWVDYRLGIYAGLQGAKADPTAVNPEDYVVLNPDDKPRFSGRLAVNIFDPEEAFFYGGEYFGTKKVLSLGWGFDVQPDATLDKNGNVSSYWAFSGDAFLDLPIGKDMEITSQFAFVYFNRGYSQKRGDAWVTTPVTNTEGLPANVVTKTIEYKDEYVPETGLGMGLYGDVGFRWKFIQPTFGFEWFNSEAPNKDWMAMRGAVNLWIKGHNANLKLEYANITNGDFDGETKKAHAVTLQAQLLF